MKKDAGIIIVALMFVCYAHGLYAEALFYISNHSNKLIAQNTEQNTEQKTQNSERKTESDSLHTAVDNLYNQSSQKVIPLETADEMLKDARSVSLNDLNDEQGDKLMKIYRSIADAYAANYRFKPAYLVYDEYIKLKNTFLERKKSQRLEKIDVETKELKDDNTLKLSANEDKIKDLQSENESLSSAKQNVYRTIWILVIIVAFFSGALIWIINHRYGKAKQHLEINRNCMMATAITSAIGEFKHEMDSGSGNSYHKGLDQLKNDLSKLSDTFSSQNKATKDIASLLSQLKDLICKL